MSKPVDLLEQVALWLCTLALGVIILLVLINSVDTAIKSPRALNNCIEEAKNFCLQETDNSLIFCRVTALDLCRDIER